ncbi:hypothetical protein VSDG_03570 [Cytospora chrysosperma]|uniref:GED domain-containing protein n=1 Tax=Cytospora chrysosperma TaxID=252740 RepID=A0A423W9Q4_CYTCH|nr:hypothetical protein VSDG_03570 [Valsa sordida]
MATVIQDASALELLVQEQRDLLDTVDDLRSMGVGRIVDLPEIIVVGDQSSGKSSVLGAISSVRFPVKGGVCTRFATELVLRKAQVTKFKVRIVAGDTSDKFSTCFIESHHDSVKRFNETSWDNDDLSNVIEEAKKAMGIGNNNHDYSGYILRIEISNPEVPSLTLIDLPGFYHGATSEQSANGQKMVDKLANRYMERKNSIILAIVTGHNGFANQKVLTEARKHDPGHHPSLRDPERTLGILTKPDRIAPGSDDEEKYLQLIQNKESANKLNLGWHVLRNRAENETGLSDEDRDAAEAEFLSNGVWKKVRPVDKGIKSLRSKLSKVLVDHIKKSLPSVREDIEKSIEEKRQSLKELGTPRSSPEQVRQYLGEISGRVLRLSTDAIRGTGYSDPFFGDLQSKWSLDGGRFTNARRLRAVVRNLNQTFAAVMKIKGETRSIIWDEDNGTSEDDGTGDDKKLFDFLPEKLMTMVEGYQVPAPIQVDYRVLESEIRSLALENLGSQFPGSPNDYLAVQLFKDQSQKWGDIAKQHLSLVSAAAMSFTEAVVEHVIAADEKTREAILVEIVDPFFRDRMSTMEGKLQELLRHYTMGIPQPLDEEFQYALSFKARNRLAKTVRRTLDEGEGNSPNDVSAAITNANDRTNEYTKVIDMMAVYYKLSLRTFTENVRILAAENCLISVIPDILTPDMVNKMDDEQLMALAAESEDIRVEREHLREQLEVLKQGLEKCRRYGGRQSHDYNYIGSTDQGRHSRYADYEIFSGLLLGRSHIKSKGHYARVNSETLWSLGGQQLPPTFEQVSS